MVIYKPIVLQIISFIFLFSYFICSTAKRAGLLGKTLTILLYLLLLFCVFLDRNYYEVTIDLTAYMYYYNTTESFYDVFYSASSWKGDYLFFIVMPIAHALGLNPQGYISFQTIISISLLFWGYNRFYKGSNGLAILGLFFVINSSSFYLTQGNVLRQGLASSIFILSLTASTNKKYIFYKVASFFTHRGSMFSFLSFLTPQKKKVRLAIVLIALIFGYFSIHFFLFSILPLPEFYQHKLSYYTRFERASNNSLLKLAILLFFNFLFLFYSNTEHLRYKRVYNLFFIFSIFALLLFRLDGVFSRLVLFTDVLIPILTIGMITKIKNEKYKVIVLTATIIISMIYSIYVFNHNSILFNLGEEVEFF